MQTERTLTLADVDLSDPGLFVDHVPHEVFRLLRREAPVFWNKEQEGRGFWAVTTYADLMAVSHDWKTFSSHEGAVFMFDPEPQVLADLQLMMLNMDPPQHAKLRRLVKTGFTARLLRRVEPHIRDVCNQIIDRVCEKGECDFVTDVAAELPLQVIAEIMGVPQEDRHMLFDWSNRLIGFDDPEFQTSEEDGRVAAGEVYMYSNQLAQQRKGKLGEDLVSILMEAEVEGERLTELEFNLFFLLLAVAGNETTRNAISGGMLALIENPDERARLLADRSLMPLAVEEIVRYISPVMYFRRTALNETEIHGQKIAQGDKVLIYYISANRDEDVFPEPDRFDVGRTPNEHIGFGGGGPHFCLGSNLAPLEIRIMFDELMRRIPDMELSGPVSRLRSNFIAGIKHMPVTFTPQRAEGAK
ncbi:MAG: cytochrome P450 [Dehalococcoidia bacterium]